MTAAIAPACVTTVEPLQVRAAGQVLSPEFLLTAASCRWPQSDERTAAIRAAATEVSDWEHFLRVAKRHRVAMQVRHALGETGIEVPPTIGKELDAIVERHVRRGLKLAAETVRLQTLLTESEIPTLVLKGVTLERLAYGSISAKQTRARAVAQTVRLSEGASVRTLAPDDLFAYLCVHGAHHSWSRLKWLADLNALIATSQSDIGALYRHAQSVGAGLCAGQALLLCQSVFGLKLPSALAQQLQTNKRCRQLVGIAMAAMERSNFAAERDTGMLGMARELRNQFSLGQGFAFYTAQCRLAYASVADIVRVPLPRVLHFIYPLLRLPLFLWRRAKLALAPL